MQQCGETDQCLHTLVTTCFIKRLSQTVHKHCDLHRSEGNCINRVKLFIKVIVCSCSPSDYFDLFFQEERTKFARHKWIIDESPLLTLLE